MHGVLPGLDDRQDAVAEALHGGSARPDRRWRRPRWRPRHRRSARAQRRGQRGRGLAIPRSASPASAPLEALSLPLVDHAIPEEAVWQCTTCGWCVEGCPVLIEHVDTIVEIRRNLVLEESRIPEGAQHRLPQHGERRQPVGPAALSAPRLGQGSRGAGPGDARPAIRGDGDRAPPVADDRRHRSRARRAPGRVLYWVGCAGAFDDRNRKVVRAMAQLLAPGGGAVRGPRLRRDLHRRPGASGRQRVPVPDARRGERRDPDGRPRRPRHLDDRRQLPALLQHDPQRVPAVRPVRDRGHPPHPAARPPGRRGAARPRPSTTRRSSPTTTPATSAATTRSTTRGGGWSRRSPASRCVEMELHHRGACAAAPAARGCGWRSARGSGSTIAAPSRRWQLAPDAIATACPFCLIMLRDGTTDLDRADVAVRDVAELLADATGAWNVAPGRAGPTSGDTPESARTPRIPQRTGPVPAESCGPHRASGTIRAWQFAPCPRPAPGGRSSTTSTRRSSSASSSTAGAHTRRSAAS